MSKPSDQSSSSSEAVLSLSASASTTATPPSARSSAPRSKRFSELAGRNSDSSVMRSRGEIGNLDIRISLAERRRCGAAEERFKTREDCLLFQLEHASYRCGVRGMRARAASDVLFL